MKTEEQKVNYLTRLFEETYLIDIIERNRIDKTQELEDLVNFVINRANRYNVKGRKHIGTPLKYYFEDVGLRNARLGFRQIEETHIMENIVYNELRSRGYSVDVGVVRKRRVPLMKCTRMKWTELI